MLGFIHTTWLLKRNHPTNLRSKAPTSHRSEVCSSILQWSVCCLLDSAVYTPMDSELWLMAKHVLQVTDFVQTQVIDHLSNVHLFMEPICVCMQRQFSKLHPLHQILKYHCRGLLGTNKLGFPFLFAPDNGTLDKLTTVGARGAFRMVQRAYQNFNWDSVDFLVNIKVSKAKREV